MRWFARRGLRVLMYHQVSLTKGDTLTVTCAQLEAQLRWLAAEGFLFVTAGQVLAGVRSEATLPADAALVTFDDAYRDTFELAFPLLRRLGIPAVVFVPTAFVGGASTWDPDPQPLMDAGRLRQLADAGWELGLHSHRHVNFAQLGPTEISADLQAGVEAMKRLGLPRVAALAYPYGGRPRGMDARRRMRADLRAADVQIAFRIGNRVNRLPLRDGFEINRLSVRGDRDFGFFQRQVRWGRWF